MNALSKIYIANESWKGLGETLFSEYSFLSVFTSSVSQDPKMIAWLLYEFARLILVGVVIGWIGWVLLIVGDPDKLGRRLGLNEERILEHVYF